MTLAPSFDAGDVAQAVVDERHVELLLYVAEGSHRRLEATGAQAPAARHVVRR